MTRLSSLVVAVVSLLASNTLAEESSDTSISVSQPSISLASGGFGSRGALSISNDMQGSLGYTNVGGEGGYILVLQPAVDYFIQDHISLGGGLGVSTVGDGSSSVTMFSISPRVGYALEIAPRMTLWPRAGLFFSAGSVSGGGPFGGSRSDSGFGMMLDAPFLYHLAEHFFVGAGPSARLQFVGDVKTNVLAINFVLGGWI